MRLSPDWELKDKGILETDPGGTAQFREKYRIVLGHIERYPGTS